MASGAIDLRQAFGFVERIAALGDSTAVLAEFGRQTARLGYTTVAVGQLPAPGSPEIPPFFLSTWPEHWADTYVGDGLAGMDPTVDFARSRTLPAAWSEIRAFYGHGERTRLYDATAAHGWPEGLAIPVHGPDGYCGVVALGGETKDLPPQNRAVLHLMSLYLHERLRELMAPDLASLPEGRARLSPGEIECIRWMIAGKSDWEIGEILGIAEATAHWRVERAKRKFGVKTRAQLAALSVHHGYVVP